MHHRHEVGSPGSVLLLSTRIVGQTNSRHQPPPPPPPPPPPEEPPPLLPLLLLLPPLEPGGVDDDAMVDDRSLPRRLANDTGSLSRLPEYQVEAAAAAAPA